MNQKLVVMALAISVLTSSSQSFAMFSFSAKSKSKKIGCSSEVEPSAAVKQQTRVWAQIYPEYGMVESERMHIEKTKPSIGSTKTSASGKIHPSLN